MTPEFNLASVIKLVKIDKSADLYFRKKEP